MLKILKDREKDDGIKMRSSLGKSLLEMTQLRKIFGYVVIDVEHSDCPAI
jgi:hypothetical protein